MTFLESSGGGGEGATLYLKTSNTFFVTIAYKGILVAGKCHTFKFSDVHVIIIT